MFNFGKNWEEYSLKRLDHDKLKLAADSILDLLNEEEIKSKSFLDIGCGTGIFSIGAMKMGADRVVGIDINSRCIEVARENSRRFLDTDLEPEFKAVSALDSESLEELGKFDIVYAWGSLHHTGNMDIAIKNASEHIKQDGRFILSIYNKHFTSPIWKCIKYLYNVVPGFAKTIMICMLWAIILIAKSSVTGKNPFKMERGMDFFYDVVDWVGGYPYEYATIQEIKDFVQTQGFKILKVIPAKVPTGCNEFVFMKTG